MSDGRGAKLLARLQVSGFAGYSVSAILGEGGSAAVFAATDPNGRPCALKLYDPEFDDQDERLKRELELKGHSCPHLVGIYAGGRATLEADDFVFLAMEHLDGEDLEALIKSGRRFDDTTIRKLLLQLHDAAAFLLGRGFHHRDIKPANIRIRPGDHLVLLDLGVLRPLVGSDLTEGVQGKRFIATRRYTPPELQHRREANTPEAWEAITSYQIGAVLYELITSAKLFAHVQDHPPADLVEAVDRYEPQIIRSDVGKDLVTLALRCLTKDPEARYRVANLAVIRERARNPTPTADLAASSTIDAHLLAGATRNQAIEQLRTERARKVAAQRQLLADVTATIALEFAHATSIFKGAHAFNGPGDGSEGILNSIDVNEQIENKVVGTLRIVVLADHGVEPGFVRIRGLGYWGDAMEPPQKMLSVLRTKHLMGAMDVVWDDVFHAPTFFDALRGWLRMLLERFFELSALAYETRTADLLAIENALDNGRGRSSSVVDVRETLPRLVFSALRKTQPPSIL